MSHVAAHDGGVSRRMAARRRDIARRIDARDVESALAGAAARRRVHGAPGDRLAVGLSLWLSLFARRTGGRVFVA